MATEVVTLVRLPVSEAVDLLRKRHKIKEPFVEVRLEDDCLTFYFSHAGVGVPSETMSLDQPVEAVTVRTRTSPRKRRARRRRNRMKTRSWAVVSKIVNAKGQTAVIYRPFVEALSKEGMSRRDQKKAVEEILRANGNRPSEGSVEYFLANTLEYLQSARVKADA